jgi:preprotein translocase subunit SecD
MEGSRKNKFILVIIILITILSGLFIYPRGFGANKLPWRLGLDLVGGTTLVYEVDLSSIPESERDEAVSGLKEVIYDRINIFGVSEPRVEIAEKNGNYQLLVDLAGIKDLNEAMRQIGETPVLDFREVIVDETKGDGENIEYKITELTGRFIQSVSLSFDQVGGTPIVLLNFNNEGAKLFEGITERNVGKPLAVFLDGELFTAPVVQQKITGGSAQITGGGAGFTIDEAKLLVERFNAGALSAPIKLINQRTVSASAAGDALEKIIMAGVIGTLSVLFFMIIYYRLFGVFASLALIIYTILTLAFFKFIPNFTMTLAGIAGFVLSIGMAVDANILIFERTKEERRKGLKQSDAIIEGFKRAWPSIRDSNTSTMITAIILYFFTSSFVRGFALTLGFGVLMSMFSAIFITRTMLKVFIKNK